MDIATLIQYMGGGKLSFGMSQKFGLPSASTIRRSAKVPSFRVSVGIPTREEILANISLFLDPAIKPKPVFHALMVQLPGNILELDNIAIDPSCRYCNKTNSILGICREHGSRVNLKVDSIESVEAVSDALMPGAENKVCYGHKP